MINVGVENYTFSGWVIKYERPSAYGKIYRKDSLKNNDKMIVPLIWQHDHTDPRNLIGSAFLENREEGVYAYCLLYESYKGMCIRLIRDNKGEVLLSPFVNRVKYDENYITSGNIGEVSLVFERLDPDESYCPVLKGGD